MATAVDTVCELWDILCREEVYLEYDLIDTVKQVLEVYPEPRLERQMRNFEEYVDNMGINYYLYFELISATLKHICTSVRKVLMASRIKRRFKKVMSDPSYKICRDRLRREIDTMNNDAVL
jgi:hypothetical protein